MNIALCARTSLFEDMGGDTIQISKYRDGLDRRHARVMLSTAYLPDITHADVVHCFNIQVVGQTHAQILAAKRMNKPVVFSPIYWNMCEYHDFRQRHAAMLGNSPAKEWAKHHWNAHYDCLRGLVRHSPRREQARTLVRLLVKGRYGMQAECLRMADLILVSAPSEKAMLVRDFNLSNPAKVKVLPNGIDPKFYRPSPEGFTRHFDFKGFVLCVGRVEPHKNQISLIQAIQSLPYPLVIIGTQRDPRYLHLCQRADRGKTRFMGYVPHAMLPSAYAAARAHVLASWFDIPGLVNLEAGVAGCNVATTDRGSAADYLGREAWYLQPNDLESIRSAVGGAMESPRQPHLAERLREEYSWDRVAHQLWEHYQTVAG